MTTKTTKLRISHRGLWNDEVPENSLGAFKRSIENDTPIELDVHLIKDKTLVVFHDDNLKRMTGLNKEIKDCTYEELSKLRLLGSEYTIPTLEEVLKLVKGQVLLDIEIKFDSKSLEICKRLAELLDNYEGPFMIKSFSPYHIAWFRFKRPKLKRGLLISRLKDVHMPRILKWALFTMKFNFICKPDFIAIDNRELPNKKIKKLHNKGIPIYVWTIRDENYEDEFDGIIHEYKK